MRVHLTLAFNVVLEDVGFFLEFRPREGQPGIVEVLSYAPGCPSHPDISLDERCVEAFGCLGLVQLGGNTYIIILGPRVSLISAGEAGTNVERVEEVLFYCVNDARQSPMAHTTDHPCHDLRQILTDGSLMYSKTVDLTSRLRSRIEVDMQRSAACAPVVRTGHAGPSPPPVPRQSRGTIEYTWNAYLLAPLNIFRSSLDPTGMAAFDSRSFMLPVVQGYYGTRNVQIGAEPVTLDVISRRGWARAGTRFKKRGIDANGSVGNFAETETVLTTSTHVVSFIQLRGSVPLYWQEKPHWTGILKLDIKQPVADVSLPPFLRHMRSLFKDYRKIHALSFLSDKPDDSLAAEANLNDAYQELCTLGKAQSARLQSGLDFEKLSIHKNEMQSGGVESLPQVIAQAVGTPLDDFGATTAAIDPDTGRYDLLTEQKGAFRVNCRDCLDRSNLGEFSISAAMLKKQLATLSLPTLSESGLEQAHRDLFSANGDALAQIYAGSGAMNSSVRRCDPNSLTAYHFIRTGRMTSKQAIENVKTSEVRHLQAMLRDDVKNRATEILTGQWGRQQEAPQLVLVDSPSAGSLVQTDTDTDSDSDCEMATGLDY